MTTKTARTCYSALLVGLVIGLFTFFTAGSATAQSTETALYKQIKGLPQVVSVEELKFKEPFTEKYLVRVKQWIDPNDTTVGSFTQRVFLSHYDLNAPMVITTEGYGGDYALRVSYIEELAKMFNTNQMLVEHRYFGESTPSPLNWNYLTAANAAADHHRVTTTFKEIYKGKWIATGISKGGQTALIYRVLYPNDMDITVSYVAPLCFGVEDGRHEPFICCSLANAESREKVKAFQLEVLKRRNKLFPLFRKYCSEKQYTFNLPLQEIYDYCVLESSFSFWQWGWDVKTIPSSKASDTDLFNYLMRVCDPDYFSREGIGNHQAFYVQAAKELGYYGYDIEPFAKYLKIKTAKNYLQKIFLPDNTSFTFDNTLAKQCESYLNTEDPHMIFVYGGNDPWSAAAVQFSGKKNMYRAVAPGGSHTARIASLPEDIKTEVIGRITEWLK